jgi:protein phosphatase
MTHVGMTRSANQDAFCAILAPNAPPGTDALLAVADGMGGHQGGEVASAMAIQGLVRLLSPKGEGGTAKATQERRIGIVDEVVRQVNAEVHQAATRPETRGMGTTLTVALLAGSSLTIGHVGDSRMYLMRNGQLRLISQDHSWVAEEVARGAITPDEARVHPRRNIITRAIGTHPKVEPFSTAVELEEGDTLLLCSDGLYSMVDDDEIERVIADQPPQEATETLVNKANENGGHDNITVVVARMERLAQDAPPTGGRTELDNARTITTGGREAGRSRGRWALIPGKILWWLLKRLGRGTWRLLRLMFVKGKR